jgi:hypothetical protein
MTGIHFEPPPNELKVKRTYIRYITVFFLEMIYLCNEAAKTFSPQAF